MSLNAPTQITVPFAQSGSRNAIPNTTGDGDAANKASFNLGFPEITMTPKSAGGIPPAGRDMNGILYILSAAIQYIQAGMFFPFNADFATAIAGYNKGALVQHADQSGMWVSDEDGNTSNPETDGAWHPLGSGKLSITVAGTNITLNPGQAAHPIIEISGTLTNNVTITVPAFLQIWTVLNNTSGNYTLTLKPADGAGVVLDSNIAMIACNGTDIVRIDKSSDKMQTGMVSPYTGTVVPTGFLRCNGAAVSRRLYAALFAIIGTRYGAGDGVNTFGLPNITSTPLGINEIYIIKV